jgi:putative Mg2+ transporter-C (MgtC) family protein
MPDKAAGVFMLSESEIITRVGLALLAGLLVGLDRESHGRTAGLRTTILVSVSACLAMILSQHMKWIAGTGDPARLAAGVLTGMGFLGAGSIIREEHRVQGVTTAAMLWYVSILGLSFGAGQILLGSIGLAIALFTLVLLGRFEERIKNDWYVKVTLVVAMDGPSADSIAADLQSLGAKVKNVDLEHDLQNQQRTLHFEVRVRQADELALSQKFINNMAAQPGVQRINWM